MTPKSKQFAKEAEKQKSLEQERKRKAHDILRQMWGSECPKDVLSELAPLKEFHTEGDITLSTYTAYWPLILCAELAKKNGCRFLYKKTVSPEVGSDVATPVLAVFFGGISYRLLSGCRPFTLGVPIDESSLRGTTDLLLAQISHLGALPFAFSRLCLRYDLLRPIVLLSLPWWQHLWKKLDEPEFKCLKEDAPNQNDDVAISLSLKPKVEKITEYMQKWSQHYWTRALRTRCPAYVNCGLERLGLQGADLLPVRLPTDIFDTIYNKSGMINGMFAFCEERLTEKNDPQRLRLKIAFQRKMSRPVPLKPSLMVRGFFPPVLQQYVDGKLEHMEVYMMKPNHYLDFTEGGPNLAKNPDAYREATEHWTGPHLVIYNLPLQHSTKKLLTAKILYEAGVEAPRYEIMGQVRIHPSNPVYAHDPNPLRVRLFREPVKVPSLAEFNGCLKANPVLSKFCVSLFDPRLHLWDNASATKWADDEKRIAAVMKMQKSVVEAIAKGRKEEKPLKRKAPAAKIVTELPRIAGVKGRWVEMGQEKQQESENSHSRSSSRSRSMSISDGEDSPSPSPLLGEDSCRSRSGVGDDRKPESSLSRKESRRSRSRSPRRPHPQLPPSAARDRNERQTPVKEVTDANSSCAEDKTTPVEELRFRIVALERKTAEVEQQLGRWRRGEATPEEVLEAIERAHGGVGSEGKRRRSRSPVDDEKRKRVEEGKEVEKEEHVVVLDVDDEAMLRMAEEEAIRRAEELYELEMEATSASGLENGTTESAASAEDPAQSALAAAQQCLPGNVSNWGSYGGSSSGGWGAPFPSSSVAPSWDQFGRQTYQSQMPFAGCEYSASTSWQSSGLTPQAYPQQAAFGTQSYPQSGGFSQVQPNTSTAMTTVTEHGGLGGFGFPAVSGPGPLQQDSAASSTPLVPQQSSAASELSVPPVMVGSTAAPMPQQLPAAPDQRSVLFDVPAASGVDELMRRKALIDEQLELMQRLEAIKKMTQ